ncbi:MAG: hypothetical protein Q7R40_12055 [Phaeospirillum sp.]|nr:hypothetical protein [Phaeospirillum sp.]
MTAACLPLVDAVAKDDFRGILAAVNDHDDYMSGKLDQHLLSMFREVFLDSGLDRSHE